MMQNPAYCIYKYKTRKEEKIMAKIIKLNVYEKTVYAVQVEDNLYIDELGVKHLSPSRK